MMQRLITLFSIALLLSACGTLPNRRGWGQDATLFPGLKRVYQSAADAALAPETWIPAAGALVFQTDDWDEEVSRWASDTTPIFGSQDNADMWSDYFVNASMGMYGVTALSTPSGDLPKEWIFAKVKAFSVGGSAAFLTHQTTEFLKETTDRTRPDESDNRSFPSGHTSNSAVFEMLAARNLDSLEIPDRTRRMLRFTFATMAVGTGWARIEARRHFPSDVLASLALGHFFGAFINDAFLGLSPSDEFQFAVNPSRKGVTLGLHWFF